MRSSNARQLLVGAAVLALVAGVAISRHDSTTAPKPHVTPAIVSTPAATISWQDITGIALPISSTAGPRCLSSTRAACFSKTPDGAALAAAHLLVRTFAFVGPDSFTPTIHQQVVGPDAPALARLTRQAYDEATGAQSGGRLPTDNGWLTGFHLATYAPPGAKVQILFTQRDQDGAAFTSFTVNLEWRSDDWKLVAPMWGDWRSTAVSVAASQTADFRSFDTLGSPA